MRRRLTVITPPALEPVTLAEAKDYLRITSSADDALIGATIAAARLYAENWTRRAFLAQTLELALGNWPGASSGGYYVREIRERGPGFMDWRPGTPRDPVELPRPELIAVESIHYTDQAGDDHQLDPADYRVSKSTPGRIVPRRGTFWPILGDDLEAIRIRYTAGYGPAAADVPETIRAALKMWIAHLYENRGEASAEPPATAAILLASAEVGSYG